MTFCLEPRKSTEFFLFVLRISICKFEHLERWSNNKNHVMLTLNRWKKTKIVIFYFHMIWTFFFIRFLGFCLRFSTKKFRCLLLNTLHISSILNYLALEPDWTCVIFLLRWYWFGYVRVCVCAIQEHPSLIRFDSMLSNGRALLLTVYAIASWVRERQTVVLDWYSWRCIWCHVHVLSHAIWQVSCVYVYVNKIDFIAPFLWYHWL